MKTLFLFAILGLSIVTIPAIAQAPEQNNPLEAEINENAALYTDAFRFKHYSDALEPLNWLYENAADYNTSIYIHGEQIYKSLEKNESDPELKRKYQDKLMNIYDQRITYFGREGYVLNRKIFSAYIFWKDQPEKYQEVYEMFDNQYANFKDDISVSLHVAYLDLIKRMKNKDMAPDKEKIIAIYSTINEVIDMQEKKGKNVDEVRETVKKQLIDLDVIDCEIIEKEFGNDFKESSDPLRRAKDIIALSIDYKCMDSPVFMEALEYLGKEEPGFGIQKLLGIKAEQQNDYDKAEQHYRKAIELGESAEKIAEVHLMLASLYQRRNMKSKARTSAWDALKVEPNNSKAYSLIGDLYMYSFDQCSQRESQLDDRLVYLAAYEMYKKAGDTKMMQEAEKQFPSLEDIFNSGRNEGDQMELGCWINTNVILKKRPNE